MTGIGQIIAAGGADVAATPMSATVFIQGGSSGVNVNSASGSSSATPDGERFFLVVVDNATPPLIYSWQRQNGANKTALESTTNDRAYVSWSGMIVGEYQSTTANCFVRDSTGRSATSNTHVIGITRIS